MTTELCIYILGIGGLGAFAIWVVIVSSRGRQRIEAAARKRLRARYDWALANMLTEPDARRNVVNYGREWYAFERKGPVTTYDELAIANDIKAAGG